MGTALPDLRRRRSASDTGAMILMITGDPEADDLAFMQRLNDKLEHWVRLHPERWYWVHRRWKTRQPLDVRLQAPAAAPGPS